MGEAIKITDQNFEAEVLQSELPALVDFWAPWCGPCQAIAPVVEAVSQKYSGKLKVVKLNTDENSKTPGEYNIMSIPTLIIFKQGKEVDRLSGYHSQEALENKLKVWIQA
jgi:thioredoxin 1